MSVYTEIPKIVWQQCPSLMDDDEREVAINLGRQYASYLMGHREKIPGGMGLTIWQNWQVRSRVYLLCWHRKLIVARRRSAIWERRIVGGKLP